MRYWLALVFLRDFGFEVGHWTPISLDVVTKALGCTRRNAQFVIKRLVDEAIIDWKSGVGRGNLPQLQLQRSVGESITEQAKAWMNEGKAEQALSLIKASDRDQFIADYVGQYQQSQSGQDILQVPFYRATHSLNPIEISRRSERHIADYLYAQLLRFNSKSGQFEGDLAQTWQYDGETLKLTLRKSLKFWDGSPLTAFDVEACYQAIIQSNSVSRGLFVLIDQFTALDDQTLIVRSRRLAHYLPMLMTHGALAVSKKTDNGVVGSGSFRLAEQTDYRTLLLASPHYHGFRPWLDGVEIWNMGLSAKDFPLNCDIVHGSSAPKESSDYKQVQQWEEGCIYACLNSARHPWMKLLKHRKYIQQLLQTLPMNGVRDTMLYRRASGMICDESQRSEKSILVSKAPPLSTSSKLSKSPKPVLSPKQQELNSTPLQVLTYQLPGHIEAAENIVDLLNSNGVKASLTVLSYPEFDHVERQAQADIIVSGEVFGDHRESSWLGWLLCTNTLLACLNRQSKPWLDQQVFDTLGISDEEKRVKGYQKIEKQLIKKAIYFPLFHCAQDMRISSKINAMDLLTNGWVDFNQVVFESH
ncbi:SgrR family transcriptional regulator [Vibrio sp. D404a]|uniref:ABC transporter substrate-binding protein n=1 Tax=unclassified Vibrio TaxID=2614977 RepID=UPI002553C32E|nr:MULTISPECIES: ABC transporter substrate-binding protein [unclassified Vibrio]MDK9736422.1 SgrR family transcriptional regulator [Vibrio sp. D404a]MDK9796044.1 SgrR family transcriptional regulator [Vibrio sp. D449a]